MPPNFFSFLRQSLEEIGVAEPEADQALALALGTLRARIATDGDNFVLMREARTWRMETSCDADIRVAFDRRTVLELVGGAITLNQAILDDRVAVIGPVDKVLRFHDALVIYLEGLVRAPGTAQLLRRYLES